LEANAVIENAKQLTTATDFRTLFILTPWGAADLILLNEFYVALAAIATVQRAAAPQSA
jgi:hypothetical protein